MRYRSIQTFVFILCFSVLSGFLNAQQREEKTDMSKTDVTKTGMSKADMKQIKSKLSEVNAKWEDYLLTGNMKALLGLYTDDAYRMPPNMKMSRGKDAIKAQYDAESKEIQKYTDVEFTTVDVFGQKDLFVEIGTYKMTMELKNSSRPVTDAGKYIAVWKLMPDGSIKALVDSYNSDMSINEIQSALKQDEGTDEDVTGSDDRK